MVATAMSSPPLDMPPPSSPHSATSDEFGYSQKLFHIANGKVYGVFSPLHSRQGRSNGKKKGLKFHNFLPAEGDGRTDVPWPSECCLREEHGTKQILVSNFPAPSQPQEGQTSPLAEVKEEPGEEMIQEVKPRQLAEKRHRRKPLQTNRIVPYGKYLTLMAEEPLDLSMTSSDCHASSPEPAPSPDDLVRERGELYSLLRPTLRDSLKRRTRREQAAPQPCSSLQAAMPNLNHLLQQHPSPSEPLMTSFKLPWARGRSRQPATSGGRGRTVIKKRLEDTFRDNGFLVKTKQVSDGDATFCKFRQLRKFTRYYLKSWQNHLPEEVGKLWKGFLPPKSNPSHTAASPSTSSSQPSPPS